MKQSTILLAEDDPEIIRGIQEYLGIEGFAVVSAKGESAAREILKSQPADLLLVDIQLEDGDGFSLCRYAKSLEKPVIFLTASGDEGSVVKGLDTGADDYVAKPFRPRELVSRIKSVLRRYVGQQTVIPLAGLIIDTKKGIVTREGKELPLSALEWRLLMMFVNNRGMLLTRNTILADIWDVAGDYVNDNTLTVYIKRLREKIEEDPQNPILIKTVRGMGYRMD